MVGYSQINLQNILNRTFNEGSQKGEDKAKEIISSFSCPFNDDIEYFLHNKAIEFSKQGLAKTHLVFAPHQGKNVLVGYYTLCANKYFIISDKNIKSNMRSRLKKFAIHDVKLKQFSISAPLIAQLGKNFTNNYNTLITGDDLLQMACNKIDVLQQELGGKLTYLECENNQYLIQFYENNGFINMGERTMDKNESHSKENKALIQMIKYTKR